MPLLFLPPWINKFYILDLQPKNSMVRYLVQQGFTVFVISWKNPDASMEDITFEDYMQDGPLAAAEVIRDITGSKTVNPVGYCIGGTLLILTLAYLAAQGDKRFGRRRSWSRCRITRRSARPPSSWTSPRSTSSSSR